MAKLIGGTRVYGSAIIDSNLTVGSNTFTLGNSSISAANGYTFLPNGLKMNFGRFVCNTVSMITFSNAFAVAPISVIVTPANTVYVGANTPYVFTVNNTTANVYSASTTTASNCYYIALGY